MNDHIKTKLTYNPWFYSLTGTLLTFALGLLIIVGQSIRSYDAGTVQKLNLAVKLTDHKIDDKNIVFDKVQAIFDKPCLVQNLVDIQMQYNMFQTINIVKNNNVICSNNPRMVYNSPLYDVDNNVLHAAVSQVVHPGKIVFFIQKLNNKSGIFATFSAQEDRKSVV